EAEYKKGQLGDNIGLTTGISSLDIAMNGLQRKSIYGIGAPPKAGKTTFLDFAFVLSPYLYSISKDVEVEIEWIYFSFEIDRIRKEFKYACYFLYHDHNVNIIELPQGVTHKGSNRIQISSNYLMGKLRDDNQNLITVNSQVEQKLDIVYKERIIPLFGLYDESGKKITPGKIDFIEAKENPTGLRNYLLRYADQNGEFIYESYKTLENGREVEKNRIIGYKPNNPKK